MSLFLFLLTYTIGKYRMVRRILHNCGHSVVKLTRIRFGGIHLNHRVPVSVPVPVPSEDSMSTYIRTLSNPNPNITSLQVADAAAGVEVDGIRMLTAEETHWLTGLKYK